MTRFTFTIYAPEDGLFAPTSFISQIGKKIEVHILDVPRTGLLKAAEVSEDGRSAVITIEVFTIEVEP